MKILVCVKQIADTESRFSVDADNHGYEPQSDLCSSYPPLRGIVQLTNSDALHFRNWSFNNKSVRYDADTVYRMNRFDAFALEEALQIREKNTGSVDVISVGPQRVCSTIRRAMELGADRGIRIAQDETACPSPRIIAGLVAGFAVGASYDLILTGAMAEDDMCGQTGQMIAGFMNIPAASSVIMEKINENDNTVYVEREIDAATRETVTLRLPAVLTIQSGINNSRYPSLTNVMRARKQDIITIDSDKFSINCAYENIVNIRSVLPSRKCIYLNGTAVQKSIALRELLYEKSLRK